MKRKNLDSYNSKEDIKKAAIEEFVLRGKHGARMEQIGQRAKINKAMIYYYYSTKDNLYNEVMEVVVTAFYSKVRGGIQKLFEKNTDEIIILKELINIYLETISVNGKYMKVFFDALTHEPDNVSDILKKFKEKSNFPAPEKVITFLEDGMNRGIFKKTNPQQIIINIISVCFFYFFAKPILNTLLGIDGDEEKVILKNRNENVTDFLMNGILA